MYLKISENFVGHFHFFLGQSFYCYINTVMTTYLCLLLVKKRIRSPVLLILYLSSCVPCLDELTSDILLWTSTHRCASIGRPARTYLHQLCVDTECSLKDFLGMMGDRDGWRERERERVKEICAVSMTWWWLLYNTIFLIASKI